MFEKIALVAAIILPFWNIPLIARIIRRRSSRDLSVPWVLGVWSCLLLMAPAAFTSKDFVWRTFSILNLTIFTLVVICVLLFRGDRHA